MTSNLSRDIKISLNCRIELKKPDKNKINCNFRLRGKKKNKAKERIK